MVNNFLKYKLFLHKLQFIYDKNYFYVISLVYRYKDHPNNPYNYYNYVVKDYYIYSIKEYEKYIDEIKTLCDLLEIRAYASVNYKNIKKVAELIKGKIEYCISNNNFNNFQYLYRDMCLMDCNEDNLIMFLDIDEKLSNNKLNLIKNKFNEINKNLIIDIFDSKYGHHIIFNKLEYKVIDNIIKLLLNDKLLTQYPCIRQNEMTLLYENINFINKSFEK